MTLSKLIEQLESATQNKSGMFELGEDTMCAVMALALRERAEPAYYLNQIDYGEGEGFELRAYFRELDAMKSKDDFGGVVIPVYAESPAPVVTDDMAMAFHHAITDGAIGSDEVEEIKAGLRAALANYPAPPAPVVPDCLQRLLKHAEGLTFGSDWNNGTAAKYHRDALIQAVKDCRAAMLQGAESASQQTSDEHVRREYRMEGSIWVQCSKQEYDRKKAAGREVRELYERPQPVSPAYKLPDGWIKCSERMPGRDGGYLTWDGRNVSNTPFFFGSWQANQFIARNITHWMPLPSAPGREG